MNTPAAPTADICWSTDGETYHKLSLGELLASRDDLMPGDVIWRAKSCRPAASELIDANDVCDMLADRASDIAGQHAEDYPNVTNEARAELDQLLAAWIEKHAAPEFFTVGDVEDYVLRDTDFPQNEEAPQ